MNPTMKSAVLKSLLFISMMMAGFFACLFIMERQEVNRLKAEIKLLQRDKVGLVSDTAELITRVRLLEKRVMDDNDFIYELPVFDYELGVEEESEAKAILIMNRSLVDEPLYRSAVKQ